MSDGKQRDVLNDTEWEEEREERGDGKRREGNGREVEEGRRGRT